MCPLQPHKTFTSATYIHSMNTRSHLFSL
uniref:Uncharacterized protein n=1 Tax=Anguilla anguilla TaxID=7936 RepID=A0A0E9T540_ANGAN